MDNKSVLNAGQYDDNVRKVMPFYDERCSHIITALTKSIDIIRNAVVF